MRPLSPLLVVAAVAAVAALAACSALNLTREMPEQRRWALDVQRPPSESARGTGTLLVRRFTVSPGFEEGRFLWRHPDGAFSADFGNLHLAPPSAQVTDAARNWMSASSRWAAVVDESSQLLPDQVLHGHAARLYGDLGGANTPAAVLELQLFLTDVTEAPTTLVHQGTYSTRVPLANRGGAELARGLSAGLEEAFARFEDELDAAEQ